MIMAGPSAADPLSVDDDAGRRRGDEGGEASASSTPSISSRWMPWLMNRAGMLLPAAPAMSVARLSPIASTCVIGEVAPQHLAGLGERRAIDRRVGLAGHLDAAAEQA